MNNFCHNENIVILTRIPVYLSWSLFRFVYGRDLRTQIYIDPAYRGLQGGTYRYFVALTRSNLRALLRIQQNKQESKQERKHIN